MKNKIYIKGKRNRFTVFLQLKRIIDLIINNYIDDWNNKFLKKTQDILNIKGQIISLSIVFLSLWVQVPQWDNDWSKCAVDVPDSSCHWYVKSPDNKYGLGFDWNNAPWFDVNGLNDIPKTSKRTVVQKLQQK
tara:strand:+ start:8246 stop:8644 length:399 start_codon:yes stop_codon:yes gene_type:complete